VSSKFLRVGAIQNDAVAAVGPDGHRRALGVHVAFELLDAVLALGLLALDNDLRGFLGIIGVDDDVGGLGAHLGPNWTLFSKIDLIGLYPYWWISL
jgi:hypothetical protein